MKQVNFKVIAFTLSIVLLCPAFVAVSQTSAGSLSGTVTDLMGISIPRAKVRATSTTDQNANFDTVTDGRGKFTLANLPPAVYRVSVTREDSDTTTERMVSVPKNQAVDLEIQFSVGCDNVPEDTGTVTDDDKAEVVRATLTQLANSRSGLLDQKQRDTGIVLSTQNIKPDWVQGVSGLKVQLLSRGEIQSKADNEGDFPFLSVQEMRVRRQCIAIFLGSTWAVGHGSNKHYLSGGGSTYEYRKQSGKWIGKYLSGWVL